MCSSTFTLLQPLPLLRVRALHVHVRHFACARSRVNLETKCPSLPVSWQLTCSLQTQSPGGDWRGLACKPQGLKTEILKMPHLTPLRLQSSKPQTFSAEAFNRALCALNGHRSVLAVTAAWRMQAGAAWSAAAGREWHVFCSLLPMWTF